MKIVYSVNITSWLKTQVAPSLRFYSSSNGIYRMRDNYSVILANPILRQIRVQNSILIKTILKNLTLNSYFSLNRYVQVEF